MSSKINPKISSKMNNDKNKKLSIIKEKINKKSSRGRNSRKNLSEAVKYINCYFKCKYRNNQRHYKTIKIIGGFLYAVVLGGHQSGSKNNGYIKLMNTNVILKDINKTCDYIEQKLIFMLLLNNKDGFSVAGHSIKLKNSYSNANLNSDLYYECSKCDSIFRLTCRFNYTIFKTEFRFVLNDDKIIYNKTKSEISPIISCTDIQMIKLLQ